MHFSRQSRHSSQLLERSKPQQRALCFESLESRRVLAAVSVGNFLDVVNGDTSSIASLISNDGGDGISLREAIQAANATPGSDDVSFDSALSGQTIVLGGTEIEVTEALSIDATALSQGLTIDANEQSRILNVSTASGDFTFRGLTFTGGQTTGSNADISDPTYSGGAIRSLTSGNLTLEQVTVTGNSTTGEHARGGGVYAVGSVVLDEVTISNNNTGGSFASGGGIFVDNDSQVMAINTSIINNQTAGNISIGGGIAMFGEGMIAFEDSIVSGNMTTGTGAAGGGIAGSNVQLTRSSVTGNSTSGDGSSGGGIHAGTVTLLSSTVSGNSTQGVFGFGGGMVVGGEVSITLSTVSGNSTNAPYSDGGGIAIRDTASETHPITITQSTVTDNHAKGFSATGGGIWNGNGPVDIDGSIFTNNTASASPNLRQGTGLLSANYSLIGTQLTPDGGSSGNNVSTDAPMLGPLMDHGGPTETIAPLPGSPAINAGDPSVLFNASEFDQRGNGFVRVFDGRIDIGSYETQIATTADFDMDGDVDGADFLTWQRGYGQVNAVKTDGDSDADSDVDYDDLMVWQRKFGETSAPIAAVAHQSSSEEQTAPLQAADPVELAIAYDTISAASSTKDSAVDPVSPQADSQTPESAQTAGTRTASNPQQAEAADGQTTSEDDSREELSLAIDSALAELFG